MWLKGISRVSRLTVALLVGMGVPAILAADAYMRPVIDHRSDDELREEAFQLGFTNGTDPLSLIKLRRQEWICDELVSRARERYRLTGSILPGPARVAEAEAEANDSLPALGVLHDRSITE